MRRSEDELAKKCMDLLIYDPEYTYQDDDMQVDEEEEQWEADPDDDMDADWQGTANAVEDSSS